MADVIVSKHPKYYIKSPNEALHGEDEDPALTCCGDSRMKSISAGRPNPTLDYQLIGSVSTA